MEIKNIIFDLGDVLLNINYQLTIIEFAKFGVKNADSFYSKKVQTNFEKSRKILKHLSK